MAKETTVTLDESIEVGGEKVTKLTMRRMKVGMMVDAYAQALANYGVEPTEAMVEPYAFAMACGVPAEEILDMDYGSDYGKLQAASRFLATGGESAPDPEETKSEPETAVKEPEAEEKPSETSEAKTSSGQ